MNCSAYFYQWQVNSDHQHCLTVFSHHGQETFKVTVMGYCNTPAYVQCMMNQILQSHHNYSWVYVDDIVIYSATLSEHVHHLQVIFNELTAKEICLVPEKFFLDYSSVQLLEQRVDTLDLVTSEAKLAVITSLEFSHTLLQLETYLGMMNYLQQYISSYAVIVKSLQLQKTLLNQCLWKKHTSIRQNGQKWLTSHTNMTEPTSKELNTFHHLQMMFSRLTILSHFDFKHWLYIDLDVLKEFGFDTHIYHAKSDLMKSTSESELLLWSVSSSSQKDTESILFLSCLLTDVKMWYWSTELKVADIVWVVKKVHHMIEVTEQFTIIYTDHFTTVFIVQQFSLNIINIKKLNLCLICVFKYLQHFHLDVWYKSGKTNIVLNTLSQLTS